MQASHIRANYIGLICLAACILGGGTDQGLWTDGLLATLMIPAIIFGFMQFQGTQLLLRHKLLVGAILVWVLVQFLPVDRMISLPKSPLADQTMTFFTASVGRSLQSTLYFLPLLGLFLLSTRLKHREVKRVLLWFAAGIALNALFALFQFASSGGVSIDTFLPYELTGGFMTNQNHLSTLMFICIPLLAWKFLADRFSPLVYLLLSLFTVFVLFVVGSRAGMAVSVVLIVLCAIWLLTGFRTKIATASVGFVVLLIFILSENSVVETYQSDLRYVFLQHTFAAFRDNWLLGTGFGTFAYVYPAYEPIDDISRFFAYHAHNDVLELILEGGLPAILMLIAFTAMVLADMRQSKLKQAAGLAIFAVVLHSFLDYPLRTYAVAIPFTLFCALVFANVGKLDQTASHPHSKSKR